MTPREVRAGLHGFHRRSQLGVLGIRSILDVSSRSLQRTPIERIDGGGERAERRVDLVQNSGDDPCQSSLVLGLDELRLRLLELAQRRSELVRTFVDQAFRLCRADVRIVGDRGNQDRGGHDREQEVGLEGLLLEHEERLDAVSKNQ